MKVIGAGLPRTGTLTQKVALEMLGFGPCYHMVNLFADMGLVTVWREVLEGKRDWDTVFGGFQSAVDWPASFFYRDLVEYYPEAKVLLSVRHPADWERSMRTTIWEALHGDTLAGHLASASEHVNPQWRAYVALMGELWEAQGAFALDGYVQSSLADVIERHTAAVVDAVPHDRLLVWDVNEGWEPLSAFLAVDVPEEPLPNLNDSRTFVDGVIEMSLRWLNEWWGREHPASDVRLRAGRASA